VQKDEKEDGAQASPSISSGNTSVFKRMRRRMGDRLLLHQAQVTPHCRRGCEGGWRTGFFLNKVRVNLTVPEEEI
jgi:hypothetical protein